MKPEDSTNNLTPSIKLENSLLSIIPIRWALSFVTFFASALYLRYLNIIGRPDLFLVTLSNPGGVVTFVAVFLTLTSFILLTVLSPSIFFVVMSHQILSDIKGTAAEKLPRAICSLCIGVFITVACFAKGWAVTGVLVGPLFGVIIHLLFLVRSVDKDEWKECFLTAQCDGKGWVWRCFYYSAILWITGVMTVLPMFFAVRFLDINKEVWFGNLLEIGVISFVAACSLLPGGVYCGISIKHKSLFFPATGFAFTTLFLVYMTFIYASESFDRVLEAAADMIGLRVEQPYRYSLSEEQLDDFLVKSDKWNGKIEKKGVSIDATMPLSFSEWVVLCPVSMKNSIDLKKHAMEECIAIKRDNLVRLPKSTPVSLGAD